MNFTLDMKVGHNKPVNVETTSNRGFTPQEIAKRCSDRLISVSDTASPLIRDQARAYKKEMELDVKVSFLNNNKFKAEAKMLFITKTLYFTQIK